MMNNISIETAPMAGWTDHAFRRVLIKCGANVVWTEMVSVAAIFYGSKKTLELLKFDKRNDIKTVVQLFGKNPEHFMFAIKSGLLDGFDEININMGCPAPKITKNGEGSALMKTPELAEQIIRACVSVTDKPISVKFRLGFSTYTAVDFANMCESAGASRIIVHGRYATQMYTGVADWEKIAEVIRAVKIPVIANGDIVDEKSAKKCLEITNANGLLIGRALMGTPWIINFDNPNKEQIYAIVKSHIETAQELGGEESYRELKKHLLCYCNHFPNSKELKQKIAVSNSFDEAKEILGL